MISVAIVEPCLDPGGIGRTVLRGHAESGGALENGEMRRLRGDDRDRLDAGGSRADLTDSLATEVDAFLRPQAGAVDRALEGVDSGQVDGLGDRETPGRHYAIS